ncbi:gamma-glutamyl-gamma-aminobutyrate hydrolase family protein [Brasilonema octagenarum]|uniref:Gamma-glutamyl-gamma-aminobutyrate hydrolase family protein n=1 Tax=Brasilonema octagenarum UFV-OR1 TaxID=417115 RepID=A0ABX1MED5_9CYAN|nr:gamma-glutamyl-gamma-aminobutyrate hydrolase family protein [Brasilonema octagenarum]NMF67009.1 gamma-glutamyl-gamma-aminobutyrate hydrolase family protein [Brasilonema octagenarum UFV-OR1]
MSQESKPPQIGITTYGRQQATAVSTLSAYSNAVQAAGGVPVFLPATEVDPLKLLEPLDGLILSGGGDIDPVFYNGSFHPKIYSVDSHRDVFELQIARFALDNHIPVLGICRGLQILIVVSGGTLIPHIPDKYGTSVLHRQEPEPGLWQSTEHIIKINPNSRLAKLIQKTQISVVSFHHQAARKIPPGWHAVAYALKDGVIEAIEHEHHPWAIGVQWHPELSPNDPNHQRIFQGFVQSTLSRKNLKIRGVRALSSPTPLHTPDTYGGKPSSSTGSPIPLHP